MIRFVAVALTVTALCSMTKNVASQPYCFPEDVYETIACGETVLGYTDGGLAMETFEFSALGGEVRAFMASAPFPPNQSVQVWIASSDCQTLLMIDPASPGAMAQICPFTVPTSGRYFVILVCIGARGFRYPMTMYCLNPVNPDCGMVSTEAGTWGRIKALWAGNK
jgi:hypothetical protein